MDKKRLLFILLAFMTALIVLIVLLFQKGNKQDIQDVIDLSPTLKTEESPAENLPSANIPSPPSIPPTTKTIVEEKERVSYPKWEEAYRDSLEEGSKVTIKEVGYEGKMKIVLISVVLPDGELRSFNAIIDNNEKMIRTFNHSIPEKRRPLFLTPSGQIK